MNKKPTTEEQDKAARKFASEVLGIKPEDIKPDDTIMYGFNAGAAWMEAHANNAVEESRKKLVKLVEDSIEEAESLRDQFRKEGNKSITWMYDGRINESKRMLEYLLSPKYFKQ